MIILLATKPIGILDSSKGLGKVIHTDLIDLDIPAVSERSSNEDKRKGR
jgi:hypothetical protein